MPRFRKANLVVLLLAASGCGGRAASLAPDASVDGAGIALIATGASNEYGNPASVYAIARM